MGMGAVILAVAALAAVAFIAWILASGLEAGLSSRGEGADASVEAPADDQGEEPPTDSGFSRGREGV